MTENDALDAAAPTPEKKKRHRRTKAEIEAAKASEGTTKETTEKKKRHRRTKAEIEAAKASEKTASKTTEKKKRHRRTKAEIEAAKAAEKQTAPKTPSKKAAVAPARKHKTKVELINVTVKEPKKNTRDGRKWPAVFMSVFATIRTKAPKAVAKDFQDFCDKHQNIEEE